MELNEAQGTITGPREKQWFQVRAPRPYVAAFFQKHELNLYTSGPAYCRRRAAGGLW